MLVSGMNGMPIGHNSRRLFVPVIAYVVASMVAAAVMLAGLASFSLLAGSAGLKGNGGDAFFRYWVIVSAAFATAALPPTMLGCLVLRFVRQRSRLTFVVVGSVIGGAVFIAIAAVVLRGFQHDKPDELLQIALMLGVTCGLAIAAGGVAGLAFHAIARAARRIR